MRPTHHGASRRLCWWALGACRPASLPAELDGRLLIDRQPGGPDRQADHGHHDPEQRVDEHPHQVSVLIGRDAQPIRHPVAWRQEYPENEAAYRVHRVLRWKRSQRANEQYTSASGGNVLPEQRFSLSAVGDLNRGFERRLAERGAFYEGCPTSSNAGPIGPNTAIIKVLN